MKEKKGNCPPMKRGYIYNPHKRQGKSEIDPLLKDEYPGKKKLRRRKRKDHA